MTSTQTRLSVLCLAPLLLFGAAAGLQHATDQGGPSAESMHADEKQAEENALKIQYLEIVTPAVNETCEALAEAHGVVFGEPVPEFGNARTADLASGGRLGVRAPMRETETPVVRPYVLVEDIGAAVKAAEKAGATIALPPMDIPGQGKFSIYILGGIEHGLWQLWTRPDVESRIKGSTSWIPHRVDGTGSTKRKTTMATEFAVAITASIYRGDVTPVEFFDTHVGFWGLEKRLLLSP